MGEPGDRYHHQRADEGHEKGEEARPGAKQTAEKGNVMYAFDWCLWAPQFENLAVLVGVLLTLLV